MSAEIIFRNVARPDERRLPEGFGCTANISISISSLLNTLSALGVNLHSDMASRRPKCQSTEEVSTVLEIQQEQQYLCVIQMNTNRY